MMGNSKRKTSEKQHLKNTKILVSLLPYNHLENYYGLGNVRRNLPNQFYQRCISYTKLIVKIGKIKIKVYIHGSNNLKPACNDNDFTFSI